MLKAAVGYVRKNPDEVVRAAKNATALRFGVPLASLRWMADQLKGRKAPKDVELSTAPPALRFSAVVDAMGTPVRASATVKIEDIDVGSEAIRVTVRLRDVKLALAGAAESPVATLIQSGALDLSKPGNLVKYIPKRPAAIVEAEGDRIVIDLLKVPQLERNALVRKLLAVVTPVFNVRSIETDEDHLYVRFRASPARLPESIDALRDR